jgi:thioester reductase-like protein
MKIKLERFSDYRALLSGKPESISLDFSKDPREVRKTLPKSDSNAAKKVLLLGATGFVGLHLLRELLLDEKVEEVYAIVRNRNEQTGQQRIYAGVNKFSLSLINKQKLTIVPGDLAIDKLGLTNDIYDFMLNEIDIIINAAGSTNHSRSYSYFRNESITPFLHLMELTLQGRLKSLHQVGSMGNEVFKRKRDFARFSFYHCGYSRMKWVAKHLSVQANNDGVPVYMYMPPFVLGGEASSYVDPGLQYSFWQVMHYANQLGLIWDMGDDAMPVIAADVFAKDMLKNIFSTDPQPLNYPTLYVKSEHLADQFGWKIVSWIEFRKAIKKKYSLGEVLLNLFNSYSGFRKSFKNALFTRSIFPKYLPDIIQAVGPQNITSRPSNTEDEGTQLVYKNLRARPIINTKIPATEKSALLTD